VDVEEEEEEEEEGKGRGDLDGGATSAGVGICDLKGDLETRLVLLSLLNVDELRRATWDGCWIRCGESRLAMRRGVVAIVALGSEPDKGGELQPSPDSLNIDDLTGSLLFGEELRTRRSRNGVNERGLGVGFMVIVPGVELVSLSSRSVVSLDLK